MFPSTESRAWPGIQKLSVSRVALPPARWTAAAFPVMTAGRKVFSPQFFAASARQPKGGVFQNLIYPRHSPAKESDMSQAMTQQAQEPIVWRFIEFNDRRALRDAPAARVEADGQWLWMTPKDIRANIKDHGDHEELQKALKAYKGWA